VDIRLYIAVIRRHPTALVAGIIATILVTFLATFTIGSNGVEYRTLPTWQSTTSLLVSQPGFPIGSAGTSPNFDPARIEYLAGLYVQLAQSDAVRQAVVGNNGSVTNGKLSIDHGRITGSYTAQQVLSVDGQSSLPIITIAAQSSTRADAMEIAQRATTALTNFIVQRSQTAGISPKERVQITVLAGSGNTERVKGHSKVLPLLALILGILGTLAVIFFLENVSQERVVLQQHERETREAQGEALGRGEFSTERRPRRQAQRR
jgi:capsular polysaccharide biosynthesis protein